MVPPRFRFLRLHEGESYEAAVALLAEEFGCGESTIRSLVPDDCKKDAPVLK